ncbi:N-acetylmuramoyl-L-alanine amidase family protein [Christiangramia forsetii]|uniref:N-acetylmuramoyl-L-alanine amidase n=2 Tax=Christiangramia forsetii TaxID=411153 RepID=A0M1W7_CHRFK|nr:N-acetylmuramoyl-L-alanine amidase [Christiangramia forsetii]GGG45182.1 N-acetylmuramoyl-L-alanine amidase [Christiangramia forsetii]CAL66612.1 N-acetylmuramoyl-L-alanine amidase [Christiangramia forsetii KT0803]
MRTNLLKLFVFTIVLFGLSGSVFSAEVPPNKEEFVVVLDAGHGGKDPGNMGNGFKEKDIALSIILKIGKSLEKYDGVKVVYTRKTDVFVELFERGRIANEANADLFVSVHCNSHNSQASGTETFVLGLNRNETNFEVAKKENSVIYLEENYEVTYEGYDPNSPESFIGLTIMQEEYLDQSILLADKVQKEFTNDLKRKNRGVKQMGLIVLHQTYMPSVLVETGFLTNNQEGPYLNSRKGQEDMARAITAAIVEYSHTINLNLLESIAKSHPVGQLKSTDKPSSKIYEDVIFRVQIAAGSKKIDPKPYNFKGLKNIDRTKEGKLFKYYYGETSDYLKIQHLHQEAIKNGYATSYIVAFKDEQKITVNDALKSKLK